MVAIAVLSYESSGPWLQELSSLTRTAASGCKGDPLLREQRPMVAIASPSYKTGIRQSVLSTLSVRKESTGCMAILSE